LIRCNNICVHTEKLKAKNNEELQSQWTCRQNKTHLEKDTEHDDWQNEDDSGQNVKPKIEEWTGPESVEDAENNTETDSAAPKSAEKTLEAS
jgi:hypothetical protein